VIERQWIGCDAMNRNKGVSMAVIRRLPKYYRYLKDLLANDITRISSKELSEKMGFTASQIRQDFNCFGDFGQQGYGYNVNELYDDISKILGLNKTYNTLIIGAGNLGQAVANYSNFEKLGFNLKAIFDKNPKLIGMKIRDIEIRDIDLLEDFLKAEIIDIGILCIPKEQAQGIVDVFVKSNIKAIWNFAPTDLLLPTEIIVENVHLSESLLTLSYRLSESEFFNNK
jgi:redox-sensing transcriptional repressor